MSDRFQKRLLVLLRSTLTSNALLGRNVGAAGSTVQSWIDGKTSPKMSTAFKIADFFGVDMNELCGVVELSDRRIAEIQKYHVDKYGHTKRSELVPIQVSEYDGAEFEELRKAADEELKKKARD